MPVVILMVVHISDRVGTTTDSNYWTLTTMQILYSIFLRNSSLARKRSIMIGQQMLDEELLAARLKIASLSK